MAQLRTSTDYLGQDGSVNPLGDFQDLINGSNGQSGQPAYNGGLEHMPEMVSGQSTEPKPPTPAAQQPDLPMWQPTPMNFDPVAIGQAQKQDFSYRPMSNYNEIYNGYKDIFSNGGKFNQAAVTARTSNAADVLNRFRNSQQATDAAQLAARGIGPGEGPGITAQGRLSSNIADQYSNAVTGIFANESQLADQRMIQALAGASGLSEADAANYVNQWRTNVEEELGLGNINLGHEQNAINQRLGLGKLQQGQDQLSLDNLLGQGRLAIDNMNGQNEYNLGQDRNNIARDQITVGNSQNNDELINQILQIINGGVNTGAGGYY